MKMKIVRYFKKINEANNKLVVSKIFVLCLFACNLIFSPLLILFGLILYSYKLQL